MRAADGLDREYRAPMLAKEIETTRERASNAQHLLKAIIAREECIKDIQTSDKIMQKAIDNKQFDQRKGLMVDGFESEEELKQCLFQQIHAL